MYIFVCFVFFTERQSNSGTCGALVLSCWGQTGLLRALPILTVKPTRAEMAQLLWAPTLSPRCPHEERASPCLYPKTLVFRPVITQQSSEQPGAKTEDASLEFVSLIFTSIPSPFMCKLPTCHPCYGVGV